MELKKLDKSFSACRVVDYSMVNLNSTYCLIGKIDEKSSLVCLQEEVPGSTIECEDRWEVFRIQEILNFSPIGILSEISTLFVKESIGTFAISTYNTDYILMREEQFESTMRTLTEAGYRIL